MPLALLTLLSACSPQLSGPIPLRLVGVTPVATNSAELLADLRFESAEGDTLSATLRRPGSCRRPGEVLPAIVLVAGRETGRAAAAVIPGPIEAIVLAVEYPAVIPERLRSRELVERLPSIRRSAYRMPGILRGAARFLADQRDVDSLRIALVGVSFGVPFAAAAGTDPIFSAVALHHGGGDLGLLFRHNLPIENGLLRGVAGGLAGWYFRRLDPARHVGGISPTPLLLINGTEDSMVPRRSATRLAAGARPPVRQMWLPHDHLMPDEYDVMRELADSTLSHFPFLRGGRVKSPRGGEADVGPDLGLRAPECVSRGGGPFRDQLGPSPRTPDRGSNALHSLRLRPDRQALDGRPRVPAGDGVRHQR